MTKQITLPNFKKQLVLGRSALHVSHRNVFASLSTSEHSFSSLEEWRNIKGYEGLYQISNCGRVKSLKRKGYGRYTSSNLILKPYLSHTYYVVSLWKDKKRKTVRISRLVLSHFVRIPKHGEEANHKNGLKHDNSLGNLEWNTHKQNMQHARRTGLFRKYR